MAEPDQVLGHLPRAGAVVDVDGRQAGAVAGQRQRDRAVAARQRELLLELAAADRVVEVAAEEQDRVGPVVAQGGQVSPLGRRVAVGVADYDDVAGPPGDVLDPAHDLGEVGVGNVVDDHADERHL